eukprot:2432947-Prymnesium_polylepis.1
MGVPPFAVGRRPRDLSRPHDGLTCSVNFRAPLSFDSHGPPRDLLKRWLDSQEALRAEIARGDPERCGGAFLDNPRLAAHAAAGTVLGLGVGTVPRAAGGGEEDEDSGNSRCSKDAAQQQRQPAAAPADPVYEMAYEVNADSSGRSG